MLGGPGKRLGGPGELLGGPGERLGGPGEILSARVEMLSAHVELAGRRRMLVGPGEVLVGPGEMLGGSGEMLGGCRRREEVIQVLGDGVGVHLNVGVLLAVPVEMDLQIAAGGEAVAADVAFVRSFAGVGPEVDLPGAIAAESFPAKTALVPGGPRIPPDIFGAQKTR